MSKSDDAHLDSFARIERRLDALVALELMKLGLNSDVRAKTRIPEQLLADLGFTQSEIAGFLGKTQSAVSQALSRSRDKKPT